MNAIGTTHKDLHVWRSAMDLAGMVYRKSDGFPAVEWFGLAAQMRRAAVSVASNISEGAARNTSREFVHYLGIARASLAELETQAILASRLGHFANELSLLEKCHDCGKMLTGLIASIKRRAAR